MSALRGRGWTPAPAPRWRAARRVSVIGLLGLAGLLLLAQTRTQAQAPTSTPLPEPTPQQVRNATREVGQVLADGCSDGGVRTGTAFVWPDGAHVVTARHVVAGCSRVSVRFAGRAPLDARPERELVAQDLLLLRLAQDSGLQPLRVETALPPVHARVAAVGYALGAPTAADKLLTVDATNVEPGAQLKDLLPAHIRQQIQANGPWALDTGILRLDGNLVSGLSGAPLLGPGGAVVAVGAGGLQDGAGGIVWAVRARYLPLLRAAPPVATAVLARSTRFAFADQAPQARLTQVSCGSFTLTRSRTVPLSVLQRDTDDPRGLAQVLASAGPSLRADGADRFDVWVDLASGAAIALPERTALQPAPLGCLATVSPTVGVGIVTHRAQTGTPAAQQAEIQQVSLAFENSLNQLLPGLVPDPAFTYRLPLQRADGFIVNRKGAARQLPMGPNLVQTDYVFLTHMTRGATYVGVSGVLMNQPLRIDEAMVCGRGQALPACAAFHATLADWARAAVGVFLSTIPPI